MILNHGTQVNAKLEMNNISSEATVMCCMFFHITFETCKSSTSLIGQIIWESLKYPLTARLFRSQLFNQTKHLDCCQNKSKLAYCFYFRCVTNMLRQLHEEGLHTQDGIKAYIGKIFRIKFRSLPDWYSDVAVCDFLIK